LPDAPALRLDDLTKRFGTHVAVDAVTLALKPGEFFCLLGPSGCGKSTLLRMIAGFEIPSSGQVRLGDQDLTALPPHRRPVNMMFQSYALFPHLSVARNVGYGIRRLGRAATSARVTELLRLVQLDGFGDRRPDTLSGGQRQRVALARALAREPELLLLDEPLGALDRGLREETQAELRAVQRRLGTAFVVVTHDPEEAMMLADRIGVMEGGRLAQVGTPAELYRRPASRFVAGLLGDVNLIPGRLGSAEAGDSRAVETPHGIVRGSATALPEGTSVIVAVRPEDLVVGSAGLPVTIADTVFLGDRLRRTLRLPDGALLRSSGRPGDERDPVGSETRVGFAAADAVILPT
jgi:putrescine transport system ATP-binding protein